jgi:hypothetical protein
MNTHKFLTGRIKVLAGWAKKNTAGIFVYNLILLLLVLLRISGYFSPFLPLNINLIYLISLVLAVILLRAGGQVFFVLSFLFFLLALFLKVVRVDIWAERTVEYFFQAFGLGVFLLFWERRRGFRR